MEAAFKKKYKNYFGAIFVDVEVNSKIPSFQWSNAAELLGTAARALCNSSFRDLPWEESCSIHSDVLHQTMPKAEAALHLEKIPYLFHSLPFTLTHLFSHCGHLYF